MVKSVVKTKIADHAGKVGALSVPSVAPKAAKTNLKHLGGSDHIEFNRMLIDQAVASYPASSAAKDSALGIDAMLTGLSALAPRDAQEGMIAAQMLGIHNAVMECVRRAAIDGQSFEGRQANLTQAAKLSRTYALLVDTLGRHRGGGTQKIIVERVTVNAGGQAIVGSIEQAGGGVARKTEEQPHAKQLAYAPVSALPGLDSPRDAVPVASDAQRPLPHARRKIAGPSQR